MVKITSIADTMRDYNNIVCCGKSYFTNLDYVKKITFGVHRAEHLMLGIRIIGRKYESRLTDGRWPLFNFETICNQEEELKINFERMVSLTGENVNKVWFGPVDYSYI